MPKAEGYDAARSRRGVKTWLRWPVAEGDLEDSPMKRAGMILSLLCQDYRGAPPPVSSRQLQSQFSSLRRGIDGYTSALLVAILRPMAASWSRRKLAAAVY